MSKLIESLFEISWLTAIIGLRYHGWELFGWTICLFKNCQRRWVRISGQIMNTSFNDESFKLVSSKRITVRDEKLCMAGKCFESLRQLCATKLRTLLNMHHRIVQFCNEFQIVVHHWIGLCSIEFVDPKYDVLRTLEQGHVFVHYKILWNEIAFMGGEFVWINEAKGGAFRTIISDCGLIISVWIVWIIF